MAPQILSDDQISTHLDKLSGWKRDGDRITKTYEFDSYVAGLAFATAAGMVADGKDHHPDMTIGWKKVTLSFTTHSEGHRITTNDVETAAAIEALVYRGKKYTTAES
jgi:4a-hydroxytetrahydrobiopterin dehydratase